MVGVVGWGGVGGLTGVLTLQRWNKSDVDVMQSRGGRSEN